MRFRLPRLAAAAFAAIFLTVAAAFAQTGAVLSPPSTLTLPAVTTAYTANQLIANNATAASVVVPSIPFPPVPGGTVTPRLRLDTNDAASPGWGGVTIQIDLWSAAPTFNNGDRAAWSIKTGSNNHIATFTCVMSTAQSDGAWSECAPNYGTFVAIPSPLTVYWTLEAITASGTVTASKTFTLTPESLN